MLHTEVESARIDASDPLYSKGLHSLERWTALGVPFIAARPLKSPAVKTMAEHRDALEKALKMPVTFTPDDITSYRVGRMIEAGLPFIASSKQMYFPFLGIALADGKGRACNRSIVSVDEDSPRGDIKNLARKTVEDTISELLDEEADQLVGIGCYERSAGRDWGGIAIEGSIARIGEHIERLNTRSIKRLLGGTSPMDYRKSPGLKLRKKRHHPHSPIIQQHKLLA